MSTSRHDLQLQLLALLFIFSGLPHICSGYVATVGQYSPPYMPTACYGNDVSEFPSSNLFASAGEAIWDNGAACGRQYLVSCISAVLPKACIAGKTIRIKIVDRSLTSVSRPSRDGAIMVLSTAGFGAISNLSVDWINVEFIQA